MARDQDQQEQGEQRSEPATRGEEDTTPIPEPGFSSDIKKTRKAAVDDVEDKAQALPFALDLTPIESQEIHPVHLFAGLREEWAIQPVLIDDVHEEPLAVPSSDLKLPRLKIWESARLSPTTPLYESIESLEISLPPRPLLSVEPLEGEQAEEDTRSEGDETPKSPSKAEIEKASEEVTTEKSGDAETVQAGQVVEQLPPLHEFLFETGDGSLTSREPICVVAAKREDDRYQQTLETLCREQFRQSVGGKPHADLLAPSEADSVEATRIQNRIVAYDDAESDFFAFETRLNQDVTRDLIEDKGEADLERLHSRIDEFFTASLGYLLLYVEDQYADALYDHLAAADDIRESNEIIPLRMRSLPDDVKRELVRLAWGNVGIDTDSRDLDSLFHSAEDQFGEELEPRGAIEEITRHDQEESMLHYWVKCFVVDCLLSREGLTPVDDYSRPTVKQKILTEEPPWRDSNLRPDIYVKRTQEAFEVETLYGTDHKKINRTIDKYEGWPVKQINVVLPNLTCLRNLEAILRKRQEEPGEMFKNDVKFWTLNLAKQELLPVDDLKRTLHDLYDRSEHVM
jgi:hypothetical protein